MLLLKYKINLLPQTVSLVEVCTSLTHSLLVKILVPSSKFGLVVHNQSSTPQRDDNIRNGANPKVRNESLAVNVLKNLQ